MDVSKPSRRRVLQGIAGVTGAVILSGALAGCGGAPESSASATIGTTLDQIATLAKAEGTVQLIAYPESWANYRGHFAAFKEKYGVQIDVANPDGSSAEELQAVKTLKGQPTQPDVLDIGYSFTTPAIEQGLLEKFTPSTYDSVPDNLKDPDGWWVAAYYGVITIGVNPAAVDNVPTTFADLLKPEYKGKIMMSGDPRESGSGFAAVMAAAIANGGSPDNVEPGIDYFAKLKTSGNLVSSTSVASGLSTGEAAIAIDWNYNLIGIEDELAKSNIKLEMNVPTDGVYGTYYAQPLTVSSPHPNAGRLWIEWLTSDEGAEQYALGGAIPARYSELAAAGKLSTEALAKLPAADILAQIKFPTIDQGKAGAEVVTEQWGPKVANA